MGYQESFITTEKKSDFNKLVARVKEVGKEYYEDNGCFIGNVITLKKKLDCPEIPATFSKGTQFLFVGGERYLQNNIYRFLNAFDKIEIDGKQHDIIGDTIANLGFKLNINFAEEMPEEIYEEGEIYKDGESDYNDLIKMDAFKFDK